ncbi:hypothetical protein GGI04_003088 [Coemansia thaxteri]|nr:hypothetical protein GGI04_003088 [Coemansia thaxteri]
MFDAKNASHVYASSETPEDLFAKYLNKQFLTNESRKRKDHTDAKDENSGGTYGFDNNGSFIRRRLAVVNEYKVTSDGPSSGNLHVKYTKQYHNPNSTGADGKRAAAGATQPATKQAGAAMTPLQTPPSMFAPLQRNSTDGLVRAPVPVRSISLLKRGGMAFAPSFGNAMQLDMSPSSHPGMELDQSRIMSAIDLGAQSGFLQTEGTPNSANHTVLSCPDLSTLSLLSHHQNANCGFSASLVSNVLGIVDTTMPRGTSTSSQLQQINGAIGSGDMVEPKAKRPKSQSFACHNGESALSSGLLPAELAYSGVIPPKRLSGDINQSLVERFLANPGVSELLQATWQREAMVGSDPAFLMQSLGSSECGRGSGIAANSDVENTVHVGDKRQQQLVEDGMYMDDYESEHEYDDEGSNINEDDDDEAEDDDDDGDDGDDDDDDDCDDKNKDNGDSIVAGGKGSTHTRSTVGGSKYTQSIDSIESTATRVHSSPGNGPAAEYYQQDALLNTLAGLDMAAQSQQQAMLGGMEHHHSSAEMAAAHYAFLYPGATGGAPAAADAQAMSVADSIRYLSGNPMLFSYGGANQPLHPLHALQQQSGAPGMTAGVLDYTLHDNGKVF